MALVLRMARGGRRNLPFYRIVVADKRYPRDGRYIEKVGTYDPRLPSNDEKRVVLNKERIEHWIKMGAKPSDRIARMLADAGMGKKPEWRESPKKSAPKAKTVERMKEKEEKATAAAEAAAAAAAAPPPPAEEPRAEEPKAEEAATSAETPAAEEPKAG
ncbi:MAG: 30S ribosomal protein S16 [Proteobacteria bacterium]|nr:30S ribosomal protein S16 [Pseudomonadota bacterium]